MKGRKPDFAFVVLVFFQFSYGLEIKKQDDGQLVYTSILYRHGDRTPDFPYKNDPYKDDSYWPIGWGMLTNNGKRQHYELGKWLRKRYLPLIRNGEYNTNLVYIRSTDWDRTLMSALSNLAGMFYPTPAERWSDIINWQPIPVHTIPKELDKLLYMGHPCPKYEELAYELGNTSLVEEYNAKYQQLYHYLTKHSGETIDDPMGVYWLYTILDIQTLHNYTLPAWTESVFPDKMKDIVAFGFFKLPTFTNQMKRLYGGPLLKEMIEHMQAKRDGKLSPDRNISVYSAHDLTVASLLNTMGVFENQIIPFAATVLVELTKKKDLYYVDVFYKNSTEEPFHLTVPGCPSSCPLDYFEYVLLDVIPDDWDKECNELSEIP